ncbi:MAG: sugar phosphate isomerase/epimerase [Candidatus Faecivivens sp.]|nr:sugar phosphate isomerase/epimerase [Oscillospiraceae bacterium]MDY2712876.1 sugar phosphate isomerase/epimerase [Candidatus Faecivivens sp.]
MSDFAIGVMLDSFRLPVKEALKKAREVGASGVQIYATKGEMAPEALSAHARKELLARIHDEGLVVSALCGDLGMGFGNREKNPELIERSKRILDLACDLETKVVTTHIGVVPEHEDHPRYAVMQQACAALAEYADSLSAHFAIETGPEPSERLRKFLDSLGSRGVAVNFDPANLQMVWKEDAAAAVKNLAPYIVHTHAKDGRQLYFRSPEEIYGIVQPEPDAVISPSFEELPLGEGDVDFKGWLDALRGIGYNSFLTIEREVGGNPEADIRKAVEYLQTLI